MVGDDVGEDDGLDVGLQVSSKKVGEGMDVVGIGNPVDKAVGEGDMGGTGSGVLSPLSPREYRSKASGPPVC